MNKNLVAVLALLAVIGVFAVGLFPTIMIGAAVGTGYVLGGQAQKKKELAPKYYIDKY